MRPRPFILRCTAFFLLLVFAQKSWAGLFIHNELHGSNTEKRSPAGHEGQGSGLNYSCSCLDDFLMPLDAAAIPVYAPPVLIPAVKEISINDWILYSVVLFSSLRGPPAV